MKRTILTILIALFTLTGQAHNNPNPAEGNNQQEKTVTKKKGVFSSEKILDKLANGKKLDIDYKEIEEFVKQHPKEYKELMGKFQSSFTNLWTGDVARLYYGFAFTKDYDPTHVSFLKEPYELYKQGKVKKAYNLCKKELKKAPVSLSLLLLATELAPKVGKKSEGLGFLARTTILFQTILDSGTGFSKEKALKVIYVPDEYVIFRDMMGMDLIKQELIDNRYDCITLDRGRNGETITLWFDTYLSISKLR